MERVQEDGQLNVALLPLLSALLRLAGASGTFEVVFFSSGYLASCRSVTLVYLHAISC